MHVFISIEPLAYREGELARLVLILITPEPITGVRSTSASTDRHTYLRELAKDTLICALDALAQSSDAFSPLKSVAGGLMFLVNQAEVGKAPSLKHWRVPDLSPFTDGFW